jgi:localization factor PodJL
MSQTGPWSVKGIDQRARDAARDAAMAEGLTLGEYINRLLMAGEAPPPAAVAEPFEAPRLRPDAASHTLDRLTRRIEATEARSTLAITGMDHTVLGLVARLENAEHSSAAIAGHVEGLIDELKSTHEALQIKVRRLETDDSGRQNLNALKSLESALGKLASHVYEENEMTGAETQAIKGRVEAGFGDLAERVEGMESKVERTLSDAAARVEKAVTQAELRTEGATRHLSDRMSQIEAQVTERLTETGFASQRLDAVEADVSGALTSMENTLLRIQDRLNRAETTTDTALQHLEATFDHLDKRITDVGNAVDPALAARLRTEFEARFEDLTRHIRDAVGNARLELADEIARAASGQGAEVFNTLKSELQNVQQKVADVDARHTQALGAVASQVAANVADQIDARVDALADHFQSRLQDIEARSSAVNTDAVRDEIGRMGVDVSNRLDIIADQVDRRVGDSEARQAKAIEQVGEQVSLAAGRLQKRHDETLKALASQIDDNRKRSDTRLSDALSNVSERLELMQSQTAATLSPVQKAIASLATRLESLEEFSAPPFAHQAPAPNLLRVPTLPVNAPLFADAAENDANADDEWGVGPEPGVPPSDPYADDYAAIRAAAISAARPAPDAAMHSYTADIPGEPDGDGFLDALSELGVDDGRSETRDSDIFDSEPPLAAPAPRPLPGTVKPDAETQDYITRARRAAIAAQTEPNGRTVKGSKNKKTSKANSGASKTPLYVASAAVAITGAAVGGYLYLRGTQAPTPLASSASTYVDPGAPVPAALPEPELAAPAAPAAIAVPIEDANLDAELFDAAAPAPVINSAVAPTPKPQAATAPETTPNAATRLSTTLAKPAITPQLAAIKPAPAATAAPAITPKPATSAAPANYAAIAPVVTVETAASAGNHIAQFQLAEERLAANDLQTGAALMRKSAQKGLPVAQYRLAKLHEKGMGVPKDLTIAREWTQKAADNGNVKAMYDLAVFMAEGEGGEQSYAGAAEWFRKGAEFGLIDSQYNLGMLYEQGLGISPSLTEALFWFEVAARNGDKDAEKKSTELRTRVSADAAAQAKTRAETWKPARDVAISNGRFGAQPWNTGNPLQVQGIQNALNALGFAVGTPDGVLNPATVKAIRDYQASAKQTVTGAITAPLVDSLNARAAPAAGKS